MVSASFRVHNQLRRFLLCPVQHHHSLSELGNGGISRPEPSRNISRKLRSALNVQENFSSMSKLSRKATGLYRSGGLLFLIFQVIHVDRVGYAILRTSVSHILLKTSHYVFFPFVLMNNFR